MKYRRPTDVEELTNIIADLELKAISQKKDIEESFTIFLDNLKPMNLLKSSWHSAFSGPRRLKAF